MEGRWVSPAPRVSRRVGVAFLSRVGSLALASPVLLSGCTTTGSDESPRGEVVEARTTLGLGEPRYFVTVECHEKEGVFSRLTLEVNQDDWMRFHSTGAEVCLLPSLGSLRLARCR